MIALLGMLAALAAMLFVFGWVVWSVASKIRRAPSKRAALAWFACFFLLPPVALFAGVQIHLRNFYLSVVPWQLGVNRIEYRKEESWGLPFFPLPGDNETGIRVYVLPDAPARALRQQGVAYLQNLPDIPLSGSDRRTRGRYSDWRQTPLDQRARQDVTAQCDDPETAFCIKIDTKIWAETQRVIHSPGSYYAVGRSGVIVIDPWRRRVFYMYNG